MNTIPQFCQKCRQRNDLGEATCRRCGTRLMLVVFPQSLKYDTNYVPTYYEDHLLERITSLELRLAQVTERLATTLDLMLRQSKTAHSDHLLLETLIESLNTLGAVEKDKLTKNWRERVDSEEHKGKAKNHREELVAGILSEHGDSQAGLFAHLVKEGIRLLSENEEKQGLRTLERALILSPQNVALLLFISESLFSADKFELAKNYLEKAQTVAPKNLKVLLLLGVIYADAGNVDAAKSSLNALANRNDTAFCVGYIRGMIAAFENNWTEALGFFKETLIAKNLPETHYLLGCVYFQLGRHKMALRHLEKAVEEDAGFSDAWFMLGTIYGLFSDNDKAEESINRAWSSKEAGAQCLEFLKRKSQPALKTALPFLRFEQQKNRFLTGGSSRLTRLFHEELFKTLNKHF